MPTQPAAPRTIRARRRFVLVDLPASVVAELERLAAGHRAFSSIDDYLPALISMALFRELRAEAGLGIEGQSNGR